ncbi:MAG: hypothetical protein V1809_01650 [Planctomycetota bacterium]
MPRRFRHAPPARESATPLRISGPWPKALNDPSEVLMDFPAPSGRSEARMRARV